LLSSAAGGTDEPAPLDIPDEIMKLGELRDSGAITNDEFERKKAELLDRM
jgi:Short C-terminal domain